MLMTILNDTDGQVQVAKVYKPALGRGASEGSDMDEIAGWKRSTEPRTKKRSANSRRAASLAVTVPLGTKGGRVEIAPGKITYFRHDTKGMNLELTVQELRTLLEQEIEYRDLDCEAQMLRRRRTQGWNVAMNVSTLAIQPAQVGEGSGWSHMSVRAYLSREISSYMDAIEARGTTSALMDRNPTLARAIMRRVLLSIYRSLMP